MAIAAILLTFASCASADFVFGVPINPGTSVNSSSHEFSPSISADGLSLYFASDRPGGSGNFDLWVATRASTSDQWSVPVNLGTRANSPGLDWFPSISADGLTLYFSRGQGAGAHIWVTTRTAIGQPWSAPLDIVPTVTSPAGDAWPNISADGCTLYFGSVRSGGSGSTDIWVTTRPTANDDWGRPVNLGPNINSPSVDSGPCISTDGRVLLFLSTRSGGYGQADLYMATREGKDSQWSSPVNLGPIVNGSTNELLPTLSTDGRSLYFCDHLSFTPRAGGLGGADIWQVSIDPVVYLNRVVSP